MNSRDKILNAVRMNQPEAIPLPDLSRLGGQLPEGLPAFCRVLESLGGRWMEIRDTGDIAGVLDAEFPEHGRVVVADTPGDWSTADPHLLEDTDIAVVKGAWGVAENGAIWVPDNNMRVRVLPFICQHLVMVLDAVHIVADMHAVYEKIGGPEGGFGTFIAGPSKTADIEQSLVLGAHGARSLLVLILTGR